MAAIPQEKLRRVADRAQEVLARRKDEETWLGIFVGTLGKSAPAFIEAYDKARSTGKTRLVQTWLKLATTIALLRQLRGWANAVCLYIPTHPRSDYGTNPEVPDDVMNDVAALISAVGDYEQKMGETLPFSAAMRTELATALAEARQHWGTSAGSHSSFADEQAAAKAAANRFARDLIAFRRALATAIGRAHPDYQRLRTSRVEAEVVEMDDNVATAPVSEPGGNPG